MEFSVKQHNQMAMKKCTKESSKSHYPNKLSINVHRAHFENQNPLSFNLDQIDHEEYDVQSSKTSTNRDKVTETPQQQNRMKLRDYLFLAKTSATKNADQKRKILQNLQVGKNSQPITKDLKASKTQLRKQKYAIKNSEMFTILKDQMDKEISQSLSQIQNFQITLNTQLKEHSIPSNSEMVMMYSLRSVLKDKLRKTVEQMKDLVSRQAKFNTQERVEIQIDFQQGEFGPDFKLTSEAYAKKLLKMTRNAFSFGD